MPLVFERVTHTRSHTPFNPWGMAGKQKSTIFFFEHTSKPEPRYRCIGHTERCWMLRFFIFFIFPTDNFCRFFCACLASCALLSLHVYLLEETGVFLAQVFLSGRERRREFACLCAVD